MLANLSARQYGMAIITLFLVIGEVIVASIYGVQWMQTGGWFIQGIGLTFWLLGFFATLLIIAIGRDVVFEKAPPRSFIFGFGFCMMIQMLYLMIVGAWLSITFSWWNAFVLGSFSGILGLVALIRYGK